MQKFRALTVRAKGGLLRLLQSACHISESYDPASGDPHPPFLAFSAIWDTGAMGSVITQSVVDQCGLKPTGVMDVHGVHGAARTQTYLVNLGLPNGVAFQDVKVTLGQLGGAQVLIGMDIITRGDLSITNYNGNTVMSFRCPSCAEIDYVADHNAASVSAAPKYSQGGFSGGKGKRRKGRR